MGSCYADFITLRLVCIMGHTEMGNVVKSVRLPMKTGTMQCLRGVLGNLQSVNSRPHTSIDNSKSKHINENRVA